MSESASIKNALSEIIRAEWSRELKPSNHFRFSSLGHCHRKQILMRAGVAPTNAADDRGITKMWLGTQFGKVIQHKLESTGWLIPEYTEREVTYRSYVGHIDGMTDKLPGGRAILEIKTSDDDSITKYDWSPHYFWQGLGYALASGVDRALFFQVGRNQLLSREIVKILTPEWRETLETEITELEKEWQAFQSSKILPYCKHKFGWEGKTCPYLLLDEKEAGQDKIVKPRSSYKVSGTKKYTAPDPPMEENKVLAKFLDETEEKQQQKEN